MSRHDEMKLRRAHEHLATAVEQLANSNGWRRMLTVAARFHRYSPHNVLLITVQRPNATRVAGYRSWQQLGRQVRKGEHGIAILAPVTIKRRETDQVPEPAEASTGARMVRAFRVAHVFDIAQTDGPPLPEVRPQLLTGDADPALYLALAEQVDAADYRLLREALPDPEANGQTTFSTRTVRVRPDLSGAQAAKTLAHELAHIRMHAPDPTVVPVIRDVAEVEAESVAHLVVYAHGLDSLPYTVPYVAGWAGGAKGTVLATAERVLSTAGLILDAMPPPSGHEVAGSAVGLRPMAGRRHDVLIDDSPHRTVSPLVVQR